MNGVYFSVWGCVSTGPMGSDLLIVRVDFTLLYRSFCFYILLVMDLEKFKRYHMFGTRRPPHLGLRGSVKIRAMDLKLYQIPTILLREQRSFQVYPRAWFSISLSIAHLNICFSNLAYSQ